MVRVTSDEWDFIQSIPDPEPGAFRTGQGPLLDYSLSSYDTSPSPATVGSSGWDTGYEPYVGFSSPGWGSSPFGTTGRNYPDSPFDVPAYETSGFTSAPLDNRVGSLGWDTGFTFDTPYDLTTPPDPYALLNTQAPVDQSTVGSRGFDMGYDPTYVFDTAPPPPLAGPAWTPSQDAMLNPVFGNAGAGGGGGGGGVWGLSTPSDVLQTPDSGGFFGDVRSQFGRLGGLLEEPAQDATQAALLGTQVMGGNFGGLRQQAQSPQFQETFQRSQTPLLQAEDMPSWMGPDWLKRGLASSTSPAALGLSAFTAGVGAPLLGAGAGKAANILASMGMDIAGNVAYEGTGAALEDTGLPGWAKTGAQLGAGALAGGGALALIQRPGRAISAIDAATGAESRLLPKALGSAELGGYEKRTAKATPGKLVLPRDLNVPSGFLSVGPSPAGKPSLSAVGAMAEHPRGVLPDGAVVDLRHGDKVIVDGKEGTLLVPSHATLKPTSAFRVVFDDGTRPVTSKMLGATGDYPQIQRVAPANIRFVPDPDEARAAKGYFVPATGKHAMKFDDAVEELGFGKGTSLYRYAKDLDSRLASAYKPREQLQTEVLRRRDNALREYLGDLLDRKRAGQLITGRERQGISGAVISAERASREETIGKRLIKDMLPHGGADLPDDLVDKHIRLSRALKMAKTTESRRLIAADIEAVERELRTIADTNVDAAILAAELKLQADKVMPYGSAAPGSQQPLIPTVAGGDDVVRAFQRELDDLGVEIKPLSEFAEEAQAQQGSLLEMMPLWANPPEGGSLDDAQRAFHEWMGQRTLAARQRGEEAIASIRAAEEARGGVPLVPREQAAVLPLSPANELPADELARVEDLIRVQRGARNARQEAALSNFRARGEELRQSVSRDVGRQEAFSGMGDYSGNTILQGVHLLRDGLDYITTTGVALGSDFFRRLPWGTFGHPGAAVKGIEASAKSAIPRYGRRWALAKEREVLSDPMARYMVSVLDKSDPNPFPLIGATGKLAQEGYYSDAAHRTPVLGKIVKYFQRENTIRDNVTRLESFRGNINILKMYYGGLGNIPKERARVAALAVMHNTGRGTGETVDQVAKAVHDTFFVRWNASWVQRLGDPFWATGMLVSDGVKLRFNPAAALVLKDSVAAVIGLTAVASTFAWAIGGKFYGNPKEDPAKWGLVEAPNGKTYDFWGGGRSWAKLTMNVAEAISRGDPELLGRDITQLVPQKLTPGRSLMFEALFRKDAFGRPVNWKSREPYADVLYESTIGLVGKELVNALFEEGIMGMLYTMPEVVGIPSGGLIGGDAAYERLNAEEKDKIAKKMGYGKPYAELDDAGRAKVNAAYWAGIGKKDIAKSASAQADAQEKYAFVISDALRQYRNTTGETKVGHKALDTVEDSAAGADLRKAYNDAQKERAFTLKGISMPGAEKSDDWFYGPYQELLAIYDDEKLNIEQMMAKQAEFIRQQPSEWQIRYRAEKAKDYELLPPELKRMEDDQKLLEEKYWNRPDDGSSAVDFVLENPDVERALRRWGYSTVTTSVIDEYANWKKQQEVIDKDFANDIPGWVAATKNLRDTERARIDGIYSTVTPEQKIGPPSLSDRYASIISAATSPAGVDWDTVNKRVAAEMTPAEQKEIKDGTALRRARWSTPKVEAYYAAVERIAATKYWEASEYAYRAFAKDFGLISQYPTEKAFLKELRERTFQGLLSDGLGKSSAGMEADDLVRKFRTKNWGKYATEVQKQMRQHTAQLLMDLQDTGYGGDSDEDEKYRRIIDAYVTVGP